MSERVPIVTREDRENRASKTEGAVFPAAMSEHDMGLQLRKDGISPNEGKFFTLKNTENVHISNFWKRNKNKKSNANEENFA